MKTIPITGTDWEGPQTHWHQQPFLDGGRLKHHRNNLEDWKNVLFEAGNLGRATALAIGIRGTYTDWRDLEWALPALDAYRDYRFDDVGGPGQYLPALLPWYDTVGLPDYVNPPNQPKPGTKFDFANDEHIRIGVEHYARVFFDIFWTEARQRGGLNPPNLLRSSNGRLLTAWHGISNDLGYGFTNQHRCQRLLDAVDVWLSNLGLGPADHVVDAEWKTFAPDLRVYALNKWFTLQGSHPSYEIITHGHVTTAVVIPSFHEGGRDVPSHGGETLRHGLQRAREAKADITLIEGLTDFVEGAELMRLADGSQRNLDALREHMALTTPTFIPGGSMHLAVSTTPILAWKTGVLVPSPLAPNRYAMKWTQTPNEAGFPDSASSKFMCLNPDGSTEAKDVIGEWESSQPVHEGDVEIRWFTINAGGDQSAAKVYGLQQFKAA